jgi:hypothetical protein
MRVGLTGSVSWMRGFGVAVLVGIRCLWCNGDLGFGNHMLREGDVNQIDIDAGSVDWIGNNEEVLGSTDAFFFD